MYTPRAHFRKSALRPNYDDDDDDDDDDDECMFLPIPDLREPLVLGLRSYFPRFCVIAFFMHVHTFDKNIP